MKTLYFDIVGGISGDMTVGSLLDLGVSLDFLKKQLKKISLSGYLLRTRPVQRGHSKALKFDVIVAKNRNFSYAEIKALIKSSRLTFKTKANALKIYEVLRYAESLVHGHSHADMHFDQVGDIDSVVDIVSTCICLEKLEVGEILYSLIPVNHGIAPATSKLLEGKRIYFTGKAFENITPTGMAILAGLGRQSNAEFIDVFRVNRSGFGAGSIDPFGVSNVLRSAMLEDETLETDRVLVVETNIDDAAPQMFEYVFDKLFAAGALDVFCASVYMKKTRPGFLLTVLSNRQNLGNISRIILSETTSSGVRFYPAQRIKLLKEIKQVKLGGQKVRVKVLGGDGVLRFAPEYEDCKEYAAKKKRPFLEVYDEIKQKAIKSWRSQD